MRARHSHKHKVRGEVGEHRARGGGVHHHPIHGEGPMARHHAGHRARGGKADGGTVTPAQWPKRPPANRLPIAPGQPASVQGRKSGGGIHIKKSHQGLLTAKAKRAGESLSEFERKHRNTSDKATKKQIVFAENAKKWHH